MKAVEAEYLAVSFSMTWLLDAEESEINDIEETHEIEAPPRGVMYEAESHLAATYLIRMFSVFERALKSYWLRLPDRLGTPPSARNLIEDVAAYLSMPYPIIEGSQNVRELRNKVTHEDLRDYAARVILIEARSDLSKFMERLPQTWG